MGRIYKLSLAVLIIFLLSSGCDRHNDVRLPLDITKLRIKSKEAKIYCESRNLNTEFYILIDLQMHSGLKRFFIWDFNRDTIMNSFLVSHGCYTHRWGSDNSREKAFVSNKPDSHASSIGKYTIGKRGYSKWGIHVKYLLDGQENTNSNAAKREIVLHSWNDIEDNEISPRGTPEGWGCPAVSNSSMRIIDKRLILAHKQVLLWVVQ